MADDPFWASLGGADLNLGPPVVVRNFDGSLEIFALAGDGQVYYIFQRRPGQWSTWQSLGGDALFKNSSTRIVVGQNADGRLELFAQGNDGNLYHRWQDAPNHWPS
jgi:hypothetical protein